MQFFTNVFVRTSSLLLALYMTSMIRVFLACAEHNQRTGQFLYLYVLESYVTSGGKSDVPFELKIYIYDII